MIKRLIFTLVITWFAAVSAVPALAAPKSVLSNLFSKNEVRQERALEHIEQEKPREVMNRLIKIIPKRKYIRHSERIISAMEQYPEREFIPELINRLEKAVFPQTKTNIINFLSHFRNRRIVIPLASLLTSSHLKVRRSAARALQRIGDDRIYPYILDMAKSDNPVYRVYFIESMFYLYDHRFLHYLTRLLSDPSKSVRIYVLRCIMENELSESLSAVRNLALRDKNEEVRAAAIEAIGKMRDGRSIYLFQRGLSDSSRHVRSASARALLSLKAYRAVRTLAARLNVEEDNEVKELILENLVNLRRAGDIRGLQKILLNDPNVRLRIKAAAVLGVARNNRAVPVLIRALGDKDYRVRAEVCNSLGNYRGNIILKNLFRVVKEDNKRFVKTAALYAMDRMKDRDAAEYFFELYNAEKDPVVKYLLKELLSRYIDRFM